MRKKFARTGAVGLICLLQAACNTVDFGAIKPTLSDGGASPETSRLLQLASDVEAHGDYETAAALYTRAAETSGGPVAVVARPRLTADLQRVPVWPLVDAL